MNIGDLLLITKNVKFVPLVNYGHAQPNGGGISETEFCIVIDVEPPTSSTWGKIKVLGQRGNIGWAEDGLFQLISRFY